MQTYKFHEDPGHAWLEVPAKECHDLGIMSKISSYSYRARNEDGVDRIYLEEDDDFPLFHYAKGEGNYKRERFNYEFQAPCRNYRHFSQ